MTPERKKVFARYGGKCAYCGRGLTTGRKGDTAFQVDHVHPRHLGGGNDMHNLVPACRACNYYKNTMSVKDFREQLTLIPGRLEKQLNFRLAVAHGLVEVTGSQPVFLLDEGVQG